MNKKSISLSSAGLQNIILNQNNDENHFTFIFGEHELKINKIFAEFISPAVSRLHQIDPTVDSININELFSSFPISSPFKLKSLFTDNIISHIERLSKGFTIDITKEEGFKIQIISVLLENEELYDNIRHIYPISIDETNIDLYIRQLQAFQSNSRLSNRYNYPDILNYISKNFSTIKKNKLIKLPRSILYQIINSEHLQIESEDSLFDFIQKVFLTDETTEDDYTLPDFLERVNVLGLSDSRFHKFLKIVTLENLTNPLWSKLCKLLNQSFKAMKKRKHYPQSFEYDETQENKFKGIINYLTQKSGGNIHDKKVVKVTASSTYSEYYPKNVVDLDRTDTFFEAVNDNKPDEWLKIDFKNFKIKPSFYSIRSGNMHGGKGYYHLRNWVIEGSNTDEDNDWKILDKRDEVDFLDGKNAAHVFSIQEKLDQNEGFRFVRIKSTGVDTGGNYIFSLSALEFFGTIYN